MCIKCCRMYSVYCKRYFQYQRVEKVMPSSLRRRTSCGRRGDWAKPVCAAQLLYPIFTPECLASLHQQSQSEPSITLFDQTRTASAHRWKAATSVRNGNNGSCFIFLLFFFSGKFSCVVLQLPLLGISRLSHSVFARPMMRNRFLSESK